MTDSFSVTYPYELHTKLQDGGWEFHDNYMTLDAAKLAFKRLKKGPLGTSCMYQIITKEGIALDNNDLMGYTKKPKKNTEKSVRPVPPPPKAPKLYAIKNEYSGMWFYHDEEATWSSLGRTTFFTNKSHAAIICDGLKHRGFVALKIYEFIGKEV